MSPRTAFVDRPVPPLSPLRRIWVRGFGTLGFAVVIALLLTIGSTGSLWIHLVYSLSIAIACWLAIELGRMSLAVWVQRRAPTGTPESRRPWPGWPLMCVDIVFGTVIGFSVGNALANLILGRSMAAYFQGDLRQILTLMVGALVPGSIITYVFYARETIRAKEAAVQIAQRQAAEHQLKLLESQLEPHMLFDTLANLRVLIGIDPPRAQAMLDQLITFMRATLVGSRTPLHPLPAEFARLADYLALMKIRMGDRLQVRFDLPPALADLTVPPMLLQPLVENSIKHGLEPAIGGDRIDISARQAASMLVLSVRDTGAGLVASQANAADAAAGTRFGLTQVRERIETFYGARASLTLSAPTDAEGGTLAVLRLPVDPVR